MGIRAPIANGNGVFPEFLSVGVLAPEVVLAGKTVSNHPSLKDFQGGQRPPGHDVIESHVQRGFGLLFENRASAEKYLETAIMPAPLGCVTKVKPNGERKHRVILDLKANRVKLAATTPERQVLPTV